MYLSVCLSIHLSIHPSIYLSIYPSVYLFAYRSIYIDSREDNITADRCIQEHQLAYVQVSPTPLNETGPAPQTLNRFHEQACARRIRPSISASTCPQVQLDMAAKL
ncbi:hypothetical protein T484DRAFT_3561211 [Baffinella frigidus]|nr:hypothetical protein T484DRAFT_3561211 [Cryptophyta sp. CCMP2293]